MKVKNCKFIEIPPIKDGIDGYLTVIEDTKHIPFEVKRVYFINHLTSKFALRGRHAHRELEQVMYCMSGSCVVSLDDGYKKQNITLNDPHKGLYLGTNLWHTMSEFRDDCVLVVLASDKYKEADYIRDYQEFLRTAAK